MIEIPGYQILRELGRGGMATVYLAVQQSLGREVAIKLMSADLARDPQQVERFLREGSIVAKLEHRHIVAVHDIGTVEGRPYLAMEYVPGGRLPLEPGVGLPPSLALAIARDIALALDHAHAHGVIHRDIKPENILQRRDGSCALSDFGIARSLDGASAMTQEGVTLGTPQYMSPEQLQAGSIDGRSDLYALGVVLHQLLTGKPPYQGTDGWAIGLQQINAPLPKLPEHLLRYQSLIDALMAKQPNHRPATGAAAAELLARAIGATTPAQLPTTALPLIAPRSRRSGLIAVAALAAMVLGLAVWNVREHGTEPTANPAPDAPEIATSARPLDQRSIAVLPLLNIGGDPANDYFSDGMAETLLDMLASVPDLKVIARTSSFAFKGQNKDVREIGRALGVSHLLEGSVQQAGDQMRISVQLVRASDGVHTWSERYDRQRADVFKVQDEIATEVVKAIQGALPSNAQAQLLAHRTGDLAAYQEYLKGNALLRDRKIEKLQRALTHFEQAIALDPTYARAYVSAAMVLNLIDRYGSLTEAQSAHWSQYIERALDLDPSLGEAHIVQANRLYTLGDIAAADSGFQRGIGLAPGFATGFHWYADYLLLGKADAARALTMIERALALDPLAPIIREQHGWVLLALSRYDAATTVSERLLADHPEFPNAYRLQAAILTDQGDFAGSLRAMDRAIALDPLGEHWRQWRCVTMATFDALPAAHRCLDRMRQDFPTSSRQPAIALELLVAEGRYAETMAALEDPANTRIDPWFRAALLRHVGRPRESVEAYRSLQPGLFLAPPKPDGSLIADDLMNSGMALHASGDVQGGERMLRHLLRETAQLPYPGLYGRRWSHLLARATLREWAEACAEMRDALDHGYFVELTQLEHVPAIVELADQSCFMPLFAEARQRSQQRIEAAQQAGLLD